MTASSQPQLSEQTQAAIDALVRDHLSAVFTAAVKEYAARMEREGGRTPPPVDRAAVTATEVVIATSELIRAVDLNLFDVAMWFRRTPAAAEVRAATRPGDAHG